VLLVLVLRCLISARAPICRPWRPRLGSWYGSWTGWCARRGRRAAALSRHGRPIDYHAFLDAWRDACAKVDLRGRLPDDLRRTGVRNLVRAGAPEKTAMRLTGHKTRAVFDHYDIVNDQDLRDAAAKLSRVTIESHSAARDTLSR